MFSINRQSEKRIPRIFKLYQIHAICVLDSFVICPWAKAAKTRKVISLFSPHSIVRLRTYHDSQRYVFGADYHRRVGF